MLKKRRALLVLAALSISASFLLGQDKSAAEDKTLRLAIGDPKLKDKVVEVLVDEIVSGRAGKPLPLEKMIKEMSGGRFIYVGESHDNMAMHDIQLKVIQGLFELEKNIAVGLEMLPAETQPALDKWSRGFLSRDDFIRETRWYVNWSMNFGYYEKILGFARENKLPVYALNAPREVIAKIRMKGWDSLSDAEKALVPRPEVSHQEHQVLIRTIFESEEIPHAMKGEGLEKMFEGLYRAQSAWDEVMAAKAIEGAEREKRKLVVLAGSGHLLYNLGINRRVFEKSRMPFRTLLAVEVEPSARSLTVSRSLADYIWGIPEQDRPAYPAVGLALKKVDGLDNLVIERKPIDGVALGADIERGDIILSVDDRTFSDVNEIRAYLAGIPWDGEAKFRLLRQGEARDLAVKFEFKPRAGVERSEGKTPSDRMKTAPAMEAAGGPKGRLRARIEDVIKNAGIDARRNADMTVANAKKEAELILAGAKTEAEEIIGSRGDKVREIEAQLAKLQIVRSSYLARLRTLIRSHLEVLEEVADAESATSEDMSALEVTEATDITRQRLETVATRPSQTEAIKTEDANAPEKIIRALPRSPQVISSQTAAVDVSGDEMKHQPDKVLDPELAAALEIYLHKDELTAARQTPPRKQSPVPPPGEIIETTARAEDVPDGFIPQDGGDSTRETTDRIRTDDAPSGLTEHHPLEVDETTKDKKTRPSFAPENLAEELDRVVAKFEEEMDKAAKS